MSLETKSRAIVLHTTRQGDSSLVVHVLDAAAGRQSLYLRGVGKGRNGSAAAAFHPLSVLEVVTVATPRSSLLYLREYEPLFALGSLRTDIRKSTTAQFVCEVLWRTLRTGDGDPELFAWLVESIRALDQCPGVANFAAWWLVGFSALMGFRPEDNWSEDNPVFDIVSARFQPSLQWLPAGSGLFASRGQKEPSGESALRKQDLRFAGAEEAGEDFPERRDSSRLLSRRSEKRAEASSGQFFSMEESLLMHQMLTMSFEEAMALPLSAARRSAFSRRMLGYLSYHLGQSLDIRSLDVLHAVFTD